MVTKVTPDGLPDAPAPAAVVSSAPKQAPWEKLKTGYNPAKDGQVEQPKAEEPQVVQTVPMNDAGQDCPHTKTHDEQRMRDEDGILYMALICDDCKEEIR